METSLWANFPDEMGRLTKLEVLDLGFSQMSGVIPAWLGDLTGLRSLYLDGKSVRGRGTCGVGEPYAVGIADSVRQSGSVGRVA